MSIVAPLIGHFDGGEISPLLHGRVDSDRLKYSLALCKNWIPTLQGGLPRRPGSMYLGTTKFPKTTSQHRARFIPFQFSLNQSYVLELGFVPSSFVGYMRFWTNYGLVLKGGVPYEIEIPFQWMLDLDSIKFAEKADVIYFVHPQAPPMKLIRYAATNWSLQPVTFNDGPYRTTNSTQAFLVPSAISGVVNLSVGPVQTIVNCVGNGNGLIRATVLNHGWQSGQILHISGVVGTTEANDDWYISVVDKDNFDLVLSWNTGLPSAFVHAYVSGGTLIPFLADAPLTDRIRVFNGGKWGWAKIIVASVTSILVETVIPFGSTSATTTFRFGLWGSTGAGYTGFFPSYPSAVSFHEDRLCLTGTAGAPERVDMSNSSDYENFSPTEIDGTVLDSNACNFSLNASDINFNQWLVSDEKGLAVGSVAAEWILRPSAQSEAITPTNVSAKKSTKWGSTITQALQVGKAIIHIQRGAKKVRELSYYIDIDGYRDVDLSELAEHITGTGTKAMAFASIPIPIVWFVRNDGAFIGMTYDRDSSQLRVGWHQHALGGQSDASGTIPDIESITVISSPDGTRDDLWMIVNRWVNGAKIRTVEVLTKIFEGTDAQEDAFFVDCGLTYNNPIAITGVTKANPAVVTAVGHGLTTDDQANIDNVLGMAQINGKRYTVTVLDADTFTLKDRHGNVIDSTSFSTYISGGTVRKLVSTISGIPLEGETVAIYADGAVLPPQTVVSGQIHLEIPSAVVTVGYGYNSDGKTLRQEAGSRNGTSLGKNRRTHRLGILFNRSQGLQIGRDFEHLDPVQFRTQGENVNGGPPSLSSKIESHTVEFDYDFDNQLCFRVSSPLPCTLLAIMPQMETQDRA